MLMLFNYQGFYGEVFVCKLQKDTDTPPIHCAVKRLINMQREGDSEDKEKMMKEFERELKLMVNLEHRNIVKVFGECFYTYPGE